MKLITLNTWGGKNLESLLDFISEKSSETNIFCFQEMHDSSISQNTPSGFRANLLSEIKNILPGYNYLYSPQFSGREFHAKVDYPLSQGLATFWKKDLEIKSKGEFFLFAQKDEIIEVPGEDFIIPPRNIQYLIFENFMCLNLHGYWAPLPKFDTPQRLEQSMKIIEFIKKINLPVILCGDFNLGINTQSLLMFENFGLENLVREYKLKTTRTNLYDEKWKKFDEFADYIFTKDIKINDFKTMDDDISDHLPLFLEFELR